jgi:Bacterial membrane protein YfhO
MNPALPLLILLAAAGLLFRRREIGPPWVACGLAGVVLLAPALTLSDGVPSPAASLAAHAPWQGVADPTAGNPNLRDITHQVEPWLLFLRDELRAGRLPFWDPYQFSGSPYWSNGSGAPLFPLHLLFALLPLELGFALLPWLRLVIGGCGAFLLARELGLGRQASLVAAIAFPFSGMITGFLLFPMGNCHALVPWVLLAVERLAAGRGRWPALAAAAGLQLLGGHPETPVFTALLAAIYLLARGAARPWRAWAGFFGGWVAALGLSAVQILPLYLTLRETGKWLYHASSPPPSLATVGQLWLRLVLPDAFGNPAAGTWWGPYNFIATSLYVGLVPLLLALAALVALLLRRRLPARLASALADRRWLALGIMTGCALVGAYHLPVARQILQALPVVQRGIHHYLKFGVELGLALFAALGWELWITARAAGKNPESRGMLPLGVSAILVGTLFAVAWWALGADWRQRGLTEEQGLWTAAAIIAVLLVGATLLGPPRWRGALVPLVFSALVIDLCVAHAATNPGLSLARLYPTTGAVRFLQGRPERFAGSGTTLHPDAAMVYRIYDIRGDSPVKLDRYDRVYGSLADFDPVYFRPIRDWSSPWLDALGVRWAVLGPHEDPPSGTDWHLAYAGEDAKVFERPSALPLVRLKGAPPGSAVQVERREPGFWRLSWSGAPTSLGSASTRERTRLIIAETWDAGWSSIRIGAPGELDAPLTIEVERGILMAVPLDRAHGVVELRYCPPGLVAGSAISLASLLLLLILGARGRRRAF